MKNSSPKKKVFITGVSSGIGRELAIYSTKQGHQVWGLARRKELLEELKKELGKNLEYSVCDIGNLENMRKTAAEMRERNFLPDVIILNAGVKLYDTKDLPFDLIKTSADININGSLFWVSEFLPEFLKRNSGIFIAVSSTAALRPGKGSVSYPLTKSALDTAFRGLRFNFSKSNVKFTTIRLGPIETEMWEGRKNFLIPSGRQAAGFINSITDKKSGTYYFPFLSTFIFRMLLIIPDKVFGKITGMIKKNE